jgi:hypothetical protein
LRRIFIKNSACADCGELRLRVAGVFASDLYKNSANAGCGELRLRAGAVIYQALFD